MSQKFLLIFIIIVLKNTKQKQLYTNHNFCIDCYDKEKTLLFIHLIV